MNISDILVMEGSAEDKVKALQVAVVSVRKEYGNADIEIPVPTVRCAVGLVPLSDLSADDQVVVVADTVSDLKTAVREANSNTVGLNIESYTQMLVATNPVLTNLGKQVSVGIL